MISGTFYSLGEAADILSKNRLTIRRWLGKGKIKGQRVGNMVLIEEAEVKRLQRELAS